MRYVIGIHNGFDVDDYYVDAESKDEAIDKALALASSGTVFTVLEIG